MCDIESEYYGTFGSYGDADGQFIWASAIAEDSHGRLFITDEYTSRVSIFDHGRRLHLRVGNRRERRRTTRRPIRHRH